MLGVIGELNEVLEDLLPLLVTKYREATGSAIVWAFEAMFMTAFRQLLVHDIRRGPLNTQQMMVAEEICNGMGSERFWLEKYNLPTTVEEWRAWLELSRVAADIYGE